MKRRKLIPISCVLIALVACLGGPPAGAASQPWKCGGWSIVPSPNPYNNQNILQAVAAVSASDVWAVGYGGNSNSHVQTLLEHWDGSRWSVVANPAGDGALLLAVTAISASNVWAVGAYNGFGPPLIEHWDGTTWQVVPTPGPASGILWSVTALSPSDLWTVGYNFDANSYRTTTLTEHWNGSSWRVVPSLNVASYDNDLLGVTALSGSNVWAVGWYGTSDGYLQKPLLEHWDGSHWHLVSAPAYKRSILNAVAAVSASDIWTTGGEGGGSIIEQWNGRKWSLIPRPLAYGLFSISALAAKDIWAVGIGNANAVTEHWNGTQWRVIASPNAQPVDSYYGVSALSGQDVWAVGESQQQWGTLQPSHTLIEHYC